jgi:hypothetical protein
MLVTVPAARLDDLGHDVPRAQDGAQKVERHRVIPDLRNVDFGHEPIVERRAPRAIEQQVELAEARDGFRDGALHAVFLRDIGMYEHRVAAGIAHRLRGCRAFLLVDLDDGHVGPFARKEQRRDARDARAGTGDERTSALQSAGHCCASTLMPAVLMTFAHLAISLRIFSPNRSGTLPITV